MAAAAVLQMFNHGLIMAAVLVYDARVQSESAAGLREHARRLSNDAPVRSVCGYQSAGNSAVFQRRSLSDASFKFSPYVAAAAALGLLLAAAALIRIYRQHYLGAFRGQAEAVMRGELSMKEILPGALFAVVWVVLGLWPGLCFRRLQPRSGW